MNRRTFNPVEIGPHESYALLNAFVSPRPIALVSTLSLEGKPNLAPFSYFMAGGANPPSVAISPLGNRTGEPKDTLRNIETTGEWTISLVTFAMAGGINAASAGLPYGESEWPISGFSPAPSEVVKPPFVAESPISVEVKLFQIVKHGPGPLSANYCIGEIVRFHVNECVLGTDGAIDPTLVDYIARMSGDWYSRTTLESMFELSRPE